MAKISTIKEAVLLCKESGITPFIWGHRGLGKSSLVKQLAIENGWGFIDLRCSQLEASDVRGLPERLDGRTHYLPPADMPIGDLSDEAIAEQIGALPDESDLEASRQYLIRQNRLQPRHQKGILFLDEVNRAADDVLQAIFQLVLDRKVGEYILPPGWCVVAAGNFMEGYQVSGFDDPAFLNRFCHLTLSAGQTTLEEWIDHMAEAHGESASEVIEFASQNVKHLDGEVKGELGFSVQPSRRSWEMVVRVMKSGKGHSPIVLLEVIAGLVGRELALSFTRYSCPVKPAELIKHGVQECLPKLQTLSRNQVIGLMWGLVSFAKDSLADEKVSNACLDFASHLAGSSEKDLVVAFCRCLIGGGRNDRLKSAVICNPGLADLLAKFKKKEGSKKKSFINRLNERPELQEMLRRVSWGLDEGTGEEHAGAESKPSA
ncbi:MAG: AAA family ATPase [Planctomycetota bacterium]|jgi:hypothetical protein